MTILLISLIWFGCLAALVLRLSTRPGRESAAWERSPRLLKDARGDFEAAIGEILASKAATAENVRDGSHEDLYVRP
ncbi:MAG: hypothetical protein WB998_09950 [Solirubrobacteraceae bacterium]